MPNVGKFAESERDFSLALSGTEIAAAAGHASGARVNGSQYDDRRAEWNAFV